MIYRSSRQQRDEQHNPCAACLCKQLAGLLACAITVFIMLDETHTIYMSVAGWCRIKYRPLRRTHVHQAIQNANFGNITIGTVNARSSIHKAAVKHLTVTRITISWLWTRPTCTGCDQYGHTASPWYNPPPSPSPRLDGRRGSGLAVIFKNNLIVTRVSINLKTSKLSKLMLGLRNV